MKKTNRCRSRNIILNSHRETTYDNGKEISRIIFNFSFCYLQNSKRTLGKAIS